MSARDFVVCRLLASCVAYPVERKEANKDLTFVSDLSITSAVATSFCFGSITDSCCILVTLTVRISGVGAPFHQLLVPEHKKNRREVRSNVRPRRDAGGLSSSAGSGGLPFRLKRRDVVGM